MTADMMDHDAFTDRLSEYLDDELSPAEHAEIEAHLAGCAGCRETLAELRAVTVHAASLPNTPPDVDLWAGVAERMVSPPAVLPFAAARRRFSFTLPQLVAAGLALMVLSGGMVWVANLGDSRVSLPPLAATVQTPSPSPAEPVEDEPKAAPVNFSDAHYDDAIADLEKTLAAGRSRLDPETVRVLEANLMAIDQAIDQCRKALRNDPSNLYLNTHFVESRNRKLALLRRATALAMEDGS